MGQGLKVHIQRQTGRFGFREIWDRKSPWVKFKLQEKAGLLVPSFFFNSTGPIRPALELLSSYLFVNWLTWTELSLLWFGSERVRSKRGKLPSLLLSNVLGRPKKITGLGLPSKVRPAKIWFFSRTLLPFWFVGFFDCIWIFCTLFNKQIPV